MSTSFPRICNCYQESQIMLLVCACATRNTVLVANYALYVCAQQNWKTRYSFLFLLYMLLKTPHFYGIINSSTLLQKSVA